jgi:hypothetical protein
VVTESQWDIASNYQGGRISTNFLRYDITAGFHGHTSASALKCGAAMEHTLATLEKQAMAALSAATLMAS